MLVNTADFERATWRPRAKGKVQKDVVVLLDGSNAAESALPHALAIARRTSAAIRIVHVHGPLDAIQPWETHFSSSLFAHKQWQEPTYVLGVARRLREHSHVPVTAMVIDSWETEQVLRQAIAGAALVVVAHERRRFLSQLLYPSIAERLVPLIQCPLLVIRSSNESSSFTKEPILEHAMVAVADNSARAEIKSILKALGLPSSQSASFVYVKNDHSDSSRPNSLGWIVRKVADCLKRYMLKDRGVCRPTLPSELVRLAKENEADVIVVGAVGRQGSGGFSRLAKAILRKSDLPVLVHPKSTPRAREAAEIVAEAEHVR
jgi:nucleotide-binding universal stress UspA family protein